MWRHYFPKLKINNPSEVLVSYLLNAYDFYDYEQTISLAHS